MLFNRRNFVVSASAAALAFSVGLAPAFAQADYPSQPVHFITGFPAGSGADVLVRYLGKEFAEASGQTVVVENKAGAAGNIGAEYLARSKPDGYTIYIHAASSIAANMHLFKNPPVDVGKQIQIAATVNQQAFMLIVPAASPYKSVEELVKGMKEKGDKGTYAQSNTTGRVMGQMFTDQAGLQTVQVAYRTDIDVVNDFNGGVLDFAMMNPVFALAQERAGNARVLAVGTPERVKAAPDYPTFGEAGLPDLIMLSWFAAMVPAETPKPVVDKINGYFNAILAKPETVKFLNENGGDPFISTPEEGQKLLLQQIEDWKGYVATAGIEPQ
ncbi:MAG TPA: tripartite tricarboxylate transporter substrate binding protein [Rhizobiaceae bacterium]|nr:tripartite tricarboxylate transporter substrate binding protein [Rhizobiaceae bacterium]